MSNDLEIKLHSIRVYIANNPNCSIYSVSEAVQLPVEEVAALVRLLKSKGLVKIS